MLSKMCDKLTSVATYFDKNVSYSTGMQKRKILLITVLPYQHTKYNLQASLIHH